MDLNKRKYKQREVEEIIRSVSSENASVISDLKARIEELILENERLKATAIKYENDKTIAHKIIKDAEETALKVKKEAENYLELTLLSMKKLSIEWQAFFDSLKEKYPTYEVVNEIIETKNKIDRILNSDKSIKRVKEIKETLDSINKPSKVFNPQSKINEYIAATSDSGFNLDEVMNPGDLKLEDLCKELGLIEPNE